MRVRIIHCDGKLPNLALMLISAWHKSQGDDVQFSREVVPQGGEFWPERVYASAIFEKSLPMIEWIVDLYGSDAMVGGTGVPGQLQTDMSTVVPESFREVDYSIYPDFEASIGFSQRGCRLKCDFCVVPKKEGRPYSVGGMYDIWRGGTHPRHIHLLDNDFFGNPEWRSVVREIVEGSFKVCVNQGVNIRVINDESAEAIAAINPYDTRFKKHRVYTAWDNIGQENAFFRGVDRLERAGIKPWKLMAYMLVGFDPAETEERLLHRFTRMRERGIDVYPMAHNQYQNDPENRHLWRTAKRFQRWVLARRTTVCEFKDYDPSL